MLFADLGSKGEMSEVKLRAAKNRRTPESFAHSFLLVAIKSFHFFGEGGKGLDFVPLVWENFDLLMRQRSYFRPSMQALVVFLGQKRLKQRATELTGYDPEPAGQIRFAA